jgi:hypothetical protein
MNDDRNAWHITDTRPEHEYCNRHAGQALATRKTKKNDDYTDNEW